MKKIMLLFVVALLAFGSAFASPKFKGLDNKHGKTTVKIEIPISDLSQVSAIKDWRLHNNGRVYDVKKVDIEGREGNIYVLEFKKFTKFSDCSLSFTVNDEPISIDIIK